MSDIDAHRLLTDPQYADACIELYALAMDGLLFDGCGNIMRDIWHDLRPLVFSPNCDCAVDPYHRWNCQASPIWAQTIRDLDVNPWTVFRPNELRAIGANA